MSKTVFAFIEEPPFVWSNGKCWPKGCDAEVAAAVLALMGMADAEHRLVTFEELLPGVAEGRWSFNTPLFVTPERQQLVRFSRAVWALPDGLLVRRSDTTRYGTYEDIAADESAILGVVRGQVQAETARRAGIPDNRIIAFDTPEDIVSALRGGRVCAYASVAMAHRGMLARSSDASLAIRDLGDRSSIGGEPALGAYSFSKANGSLRCGL